MVIAAMKLKDAYSLEGKLTTNLDSILKSRDITLPTKVCLVKAMVFPLVRYGCESLWRKLSTEELMLLNCGVGEDLRVPCTAGRSNQYILKEIIPGCSLEGLMLKLKLQYFGHLMWRIDSLEKTLMLGGIGGRRRRGRQRMKMKMKRMASLTRWTWLWVNSGSWWWTGRPGVLRFMGSQSRTRLSNWTELKHWKRHVSTWTGLHCAWAGQQSCHCWSRRGWEPAPVLWGEMLDWMSYKLELRQEGEHQPQMCRWYHSNGRKQRGTEEFLDEGEGREWKSQLKTKY